MRDYKHEYALKMAKNKRLQADIKREKAEAFLQALEARGVSFVSWLEHHINNELKA